MAKVHFALSNGHGSVHRRTVCVPTGQTECHYSTVLLTWASIAYDVMAKWQGCIKWPLPWLESLSYATHVKSLSRHKVILSRLSGKPAPCPFGGANSCVRWRNMQLRWKMQILLFHVKKIGYPGRNKKLIRMIFSF